MLHFVAQHLSVFIFFFLGPCWYSESFDHVCNLITGDSTLHTLVRSKYFECTCTILGRRQSKTLVTIDERSSKIARNSVFDCHLSPVGRQMTIENSVSNYFGLRSSIVWTFSIAAYPVCIH